MHAFLYAFQRVFTLFSLFHRITEETLVCARFSSRFSTFFYTLFPFPQDHRKRRLLVHATYLLVLQEMVKSRRPTRPSRPGFRSKRVFLRREDTSTWQSFIDDPEFDKQTEPGDIIPFSCRRSTSEWPPSKRTGEKRLHRVCVSLIAHSCVNG